MPKHAASDVLSRASCSAESLCSSGAFLGSEGRLAGTHPGCTAGSEAVSIATPRDFCTLLTLGFKGCDPY